MDRTVNSAFDNGCAELPCLEWVLLSREQAAIFADTPARRDRRRARAFLSKMLDKSS